MATIVSFNASMRTRKATSSSNAKSAQVCQEFYTTGYNYVGILHFAGMALTGKVITGISLSVTAAKAGYGAGSTKTVYVRKSNYQEASASGVTGLAYAGDALGTFSGSFYGNTTSTAFSGTLLTNLATYFSSGKNTICLYNPSPSAGSQGYSYNYLQWDSATITITYEEAASVPTMSAYTLDMGTAVTLYTNRQSTAATHTLRYSFFSANATIATGVAASVSWTPPVSLAAQLPSATSGWGTLFCDTYVGGQLISTNSCTFTLNVPASVVPSVSAVSLSEAVTGLSAYGGYIRTRSKLKVTIIASGSQGSTISSYRTSIDGSSYSLSDFTSNTLKTAGTIKVTVTVTDSRGRTGSYEQSITVLDYSPPSLTKFSAERCNSAGTAAQRDGNRVRVSLAGSASSLGSKNTLTCTVYYRITSNTAWTQSTTVATSNYAVSATNLLLGQTFNTLNSYELMVRLVDAFNTVDQTVPVGTKTVMMDFYKDGSGIAFGKVAETSGKVEFGWPLILSSALGLDQGGTGATTAAAALANLGGVKKAGDTMTGNLNIEGYLYPSMKLVPTYNGTANHTVFEGSYIGASSFASWEDSTGNNRRMLEVRTAGYADMNWAVVLRTCINGAWGTHRIFHAGMITPIPVANGGTAASDAANARSNLGCNNASNLNTGTIAAARLPFKVAYGSANISGSSAATINYASAGFTSAPCVVATYSTTSGNWSGDNGAIKVSSKSTTQASIIVGGSFSTLRAIDWIAIGT